jgi:hypothetical protein
LSKHDAYAYVAQLSSRDLIAVLVLPYGKTSANQQQTIFLGGGELQGLKKGNGGDPFCEFTPPPAENAAQQEVG